ncbi:MAG TPA: hypothetical protein VGO22_19230, partial [Pseudorhizobium sp.]|nr:hypothetical protein [Pseudorhizobium sp.]
MLPARFHEIRDRAMAAVDNVFGEPVRLSPMVEGRRDPDRPQVEVEAVLRVGGGQETNANGGYGQSWRTQIAAGRAELHINRAAYTGPRIISGDKVRAIARRG